jgi:hypothetical protein
VKTLSDSSESSASGRIFDYASLCRLLKLTVGRRNGSAFYASKWRFCFLLPDAMRSAIGFGTDNGRESIGGHWPNYPFSPHCP